MPVFQHLKLQHNNNNNNNTTDNDYLINHKTSRIHFLYCAKILLTLIVVYVITLLTKHVDYISKLNVDLSLNPSDDEFLLDVSQTVDLPFQQDLSFSISDGIKIGDNVPNCGLSHVCANNEFPIHLFTGKDNQEYPKLCIDGKYILDRGLNNCGRGMNVAIIDNVTRSILRVSNFDTYDKDSTPLEALLLTLRHGDIIVMLTFDEPTSKMSQISKLLLHEMGSSMAQNLIYRSSWYLITQKGISGYTPYENLHLPNNGGWAESHDIRTCIPLNIEPIAVQPDPILYGNTKRAQFCANHLNQFPLFCEGNEVNDPLISAHILKYLPISTELVNTPIIALTGQSYLENFYLPLTLETIFLQPGIKTRNVIVFYNPIHCPVIASLADVFDFMSTEYSSSDDTIEDVLRTTELLFPDAKAFIVIDINTILSPDFLTYMGQMLTFLITDRSDIASISAWNDNGYETTSHAYELVYRVNSTNYRPRFAAMFKRGFRFNGTSMLWSFEEYPIDGDVVIPDVSRVLYLNNRQIAVSEFGESEIQNFVNDFMRRNRSINIEDEVLLRGFDIGDCSKFYEQSVRDMINMSVTVAGIQYLENLASLNHNSKRYFSIYCDNDIQCQKLCAELELANCLPHIVVSEIGGVIRFSNSFGDTIFLINKNYI